MEEFFGVGDTLIFFGTLEVAGAELSLLLFALQEHIVNNAINKNEKFILNNIIDFFSVLK